MSCLVGPLLYRSLEPLVAAIMNWLIKHKLWHRLQDLLKALHVDCTSWPVLFSALQFENMLLLSLMVVEASLLVVN